jgi:hypothetical protein
VHRVFGVDPLKEIPRANRESARVQKPEVPVMAVISTAAAITGTFGFCIFPVSLGNSLGASTPNAQCTDAAVFTGTVG